MTDILKNSKVKTGAQTVAYGITMAGAMETIMWLFQISIGITMPVAVAGFLAGCLVPLIRHYLTKLE